MLGARRRGVIPAPLEVTHRRRAHARGETPGPGRSGPSRPPQAETLRLGRTGQRRTEGRQTRCGPFGPGKENPPRSRLRITTSRSAGMPAENS